MKRLALLLAACIVLAGCSGGKDSDDDGTSSTSSSSSRSTTGGPTPGSIAAELARSTPNGAVPLAVNVTIDATFQPTGAAPLASPPPGAAWTLVAESLGNATDGTIDENATGEMVEERSGTAFPANESLELAEPGTYRLTLNVTAPGYAPGEDSVIVLAEAASGGGTGGGTLFFEGGEADESQWELSSNVLVTNTAPDAPEVEVPQDHPSGSWEITDTQVRTGTKAWGTPYPDNYRARMTSVPIAIPAGGATLTYWIKGGAEANNFDGLFVLAGPADGLVDVGYHSGPFAEWTESTVSLAAFAGQEIVLQFRMDSDLSCSNDGPPAGGDNLCGAGFDGGGIMVDDITVA